MVYIIWEFRANESHIAEFEQVYGLQGAWSKLFQKSPGYHGTQLLIDHSTPPGRYFTIDCWKQLDAFEHFKAKFAEKYQMLDKYCENLTQSEQKIGNFGRLLITQTRDIIQFPNQQTNCVNPH